MRWEVRRRTTTEDPGRPNRAAEYITGSTLVHILSGGLV